MSELVLDALRMLGHSPDWTHVEIVAKKVFHNDLRRRQQRIEQASTSSAVWISGRRS
jgi:hypothetical protein